MREAPSTHAVKTPARKPSKKKNDRIQREVKALKKKLQERNVDLTNLTEAQLRRFILDNKKN